MAELVTSDKPSVGEIVIGQIKRVERFGAYVDLLDYPGWEGFIHISEISLKWVRNIRDYLKEGQKEVFKILRVDQHLNQVDLSLRRVEKNEREQKIIEWKRKQKVSRILAILSERVNMPLEDLKKMLSEPVAKRGLHLYDVFTEMLEEDKTPEWLKLDDNLKSKLIDLVKQEIKLKKAVLRGELILTNKRGDGVEHIKNTIDEALKLAGKGELVSITSIGPPRYMVRVEAGSQDRVEELFQEVVERCINLIKESGGEGQLVKKL